MKATITDVITKTVNVRTVSTKDWKHNENKTNSMRVMRLSVQ